MMARFDNVCEHLDFDVGPARAKPSLWQRLQRSFLVAALATTPALLFARLTALRRAGVHPRFSDRTAGAVVTPGDWSFQPVRTAKNLTTYTYVRDEEITLSCSKALRTMPAAP